ncbi:hypothetical protein FNY09_24930 [Salmonella enterica]|nr:hypothetical protein [Salmonella enterica]EBV5784264.1 hypothetical protein [Salmonella enterica subsp. enterica serovar Rubislaw]EDC7034166.1 hypothetical protein [Salmonella enterica subsp. enterica serovar Muenchen]EAA8564478.1 hypothetical protein [Salmonella enterica]EAM8330325.1 hypothetical protein [Salmonella enterica]
MEGEILISLRLWQIFFIILPAGVITGYFARHLELSTFYQTLLTAFVSILIMFIFSFLNKRNYCD